MERIPKSIFLNPVDENEVEAMINNLKESSPGWDVISPKLLLLKYILPSILKPVVRILNTVLLIKFLPSLPVTAERGSAPSAHYPPERATSGIATCSGVGDTYRPVAKLSPALGW